MSTPDPVPPAEVGYHQVVTPAEADDRCPNVDRDGHHRPDLCLDGGELAQPLCYVCMACWRHIRADRYAGHAARCRRAAGMDR